MYRNRERGPVGPDHRDADKEIREKRQEIVEEMLLKADVVDEGMEGIVMKFDFELLTDDQREFLRGQGVDVTGDSAVKLMKVYEAGKAHHEYDMQQEAYRILGGGKENVSGVPKPFFASEFEVNGAIAERFSHLQNGGRGEVVLMEFVPGVDIEMQLYKKAYELLGFELAEGANYTIDQLRREVSAALQFEASEVPGKFPHIHNDTPNARKLLSFLRSQGFELGGRFLMQIHEAIKRLERAGIVHADLHGRNVIVDGDIFSDEANVESYIIDFGFSYSTSRAAFRTQREGVERHDRSLITTLSRISPGFEQRQEARRAERIKRRESAEKKMIEAARHFQTEMRAVQAEADWSRERKKVWSALKSERVRLRGASSMPEVARNRFYRELAQRIVELTFDSSLDDQEHKNRIHDIVVTLVSTYRDNNGFLEALPRVVNRRDRQIIEDYLRFKDRL